MAIVPSGYPAWTRLADHTQYGGNVNKRNYMLIGAVNAQTDVTAEEWCRAASDLAAVVRTAPMWVIDFTNNDTAGDPPTINRIYGMTGVRLTSYEGDNAPTGFPSAVSNGDGDVTFTFESSYSDDYGVAGDFAISWALASIRDNDSTLKNGTVIYTDTTAQVLCFSGSAGGTVLADARVSLVIG